MLWAAVYKNCRSVRVKTELNFLTLHSVLRQTCKVSFVTTMDDSTHGVHSCQQQLMHSTKCTNVSQQEESLAMCVYDGIVITMQY